MCYTMWGKTQKTQCITEDKEKTEEYFLRIAFSLQISFVLRLTVSVKEKSQVSNMLLLPAGF